MFTKKIVVQKAFVGLPKVTDFKIVEETLPALKTGEILTEAVCFSVDPYIRAYAANEGDTINAFQVAKVLQSKHPDFKENDLVVGTLGWQTRKITAVNALENNSTILYTLPDIGDLPPSLGLGVLGMPGSTAYFGFLEICKPKQGQIVVVSGAAGAVGSHVAQIARHIGCIVIGIAGTDAKVKYLLDELKLDAAFNYKNGDLAANLVSIAPKGIDCYFDNVGGEISSIVMYLMKESGRVSVCGSICAYNSDPRNLPKVTILQPAIVMKQLIVEGFLVTRWNHRREEGFKYNLQGIKEGWLKYKETVFHGFEKIPECFIDMLTGGNIGKAVVKL